MYRDVASVIFALPCTSISPSPSAISPAACAATPAGPCS
jgi:hypothetical protein